jgi:hypothetical protein
MAARTKPSAIRAMTRNVVPRPSHLGTKKAMRHMKRKVMIKIAAITPERDIFPSGTKE